MQQNDDSFSKMTDDELKSLFEVIIRDGLTIDEIRTHVIQVIDAYDEGCIDFDGKNCDECDGWNG